MAKVAACRIRLKRDGPHTILTTKPKKGAFREGEIGDYQLVFKAGQRIKPGVEYTIRARLLTSDTPTVDLRRAAR
jgi:hypothetical protein